MLLIHHNQIPYLENSTEKKNRMVGIPPSIRRRRPLLPPPPRRCSDGNVLDMLSKEEGNSNKSMVVDLKCRSSRAYYFRRCKRVRLTTGIDSLPDDLLLEILVRLPAHHVYSGARVVCRRWYHLIHSHAFINTHFHRCTYGLVFAGDDHNPIFVTATQGRIETYEFSNTNKCSTEVFASCNGLGLLSVFSGVPHIINMATKQLFSLPSLPATSATTRVSTIYSFKSGIAYAAASMEYKVIIQFSNESLFIVTVGVDNSWRSVPVEHISAEARRFLIGQVPLISEGFMHWVRAGVPYSFTLDVEMEILTESKVPLRPSYFSRHMYYMSTGRYPSLLVAHKNKDFLWEHWEMNSKTGEWTKLLPDIEFVPRKCWLEQFDSRRRRPNAVLKPIGWVKYPEILALHFDGDNTTCIFFNLDTHEISSTQIPITTLQFRYSAYLHKNSLMWLT